MIDVNMYVRREGIETTGHFRSYDKNRLAYLYELILYLQYKYHHNPPIII